MKYICVHALQKINMSKIYIYNESWLKVMKYLILLRLGPPQPQGNLSPLV
jgi:hypothetical protein